MFYLPSELACDLLLPFLAYVHGLYEFVILVDRNFEAVIHQFALLLREMGTMLILLAEIRQR